MSPQVYRTIALLLGGASGIGKGYATELAKEGFNIFIIDKNEGDTADAERELQKLGAKCGHIIYDFGILGDSQEAENFRSLLDSALAGKDVAILINNVAEFQHVEFANASAEMIFRQTSSFLSSRVGFSDNAGGCVRMSHFLCLIFKPIFDH